MDGAADASPANKFIIQALLIESEVTMKCCLCYEEIDVNVFGWTEGHNADPLSEDGRCCSICNATKVIPARLNIIEPIINADLKAVEGERDVKESVS
jgi:hypothetical protein